MPDTPRAAASPQLAVGTLALSLPAGFERRAARIGRFTAEALAAAPPAARAAHIEVLRLPAQGVRAGWSDRRIAAALAAAICRQIERGEG